MKLNLFKLTMSTIYEKGWQLMEKTNSDFETVHTNIQGVDQATHFVVAQIVCLFILFHSTEKTVPLDRLLNELWGRKRWNTKRFHRRRKVNEIEGHLMKSRGSLRIKLTVTTFYRNGGSL